MSYPLERECSPEPPARISKDPGQMELPGKVIYRRNNVYDIELADGHGPSRIINRAELLGVCAARDPEPIPAAEPDRPVPLRRSAGVYKGRHSNPYREPRTVF